MSITSISFIIFVICSVLLFMVFPKKYRWISLLISSGVFYLLSDYRCAIFMLISTFTVWLCGKGITKNFSSEEQQLKEITDKQEKKELKKKNKKVRKNYLLVALFVNIGLLIFFKAAKFWNIPVAGFLMDKDTMSIVMPLGISYYTFSVVGYLLDVYWKRYKCEPDFLRFLGWAIYFPHILQGPISRYNLLGAELKKELPLKWDNFKFGLELVLWGCFKKLVVADRLSIYVNAVLYGEDSWNILSVGIVGALAMIFDALMIYTDFSGYVDIVTGISQMFGVKLEQNFNRPFMSKTVPEFWRRWHMSLGSWFKDYVYYPISVSPACKGLSKKLKGKVSDRIISIIVTLIPVMCTWILTGLWHGTGTGYLMWGIYYGTLIALSVLFTPQVVAFQKKCGINTETLSWRIFQRVKIFCIFMGGRLLGNPLGISTRIHILSCIFKDFVRGRWWSDIVYKYGLNAANFRIIGLSAILLIIVALLQEKGSIREMLDRQDFIVKVIVLTVGVYIVFLLGVYGTQYDVGSFMYQQF